jgi:phage-related protein
MIPTRQLHSLCSWCIRGKYRSVMAVIMQARTTSIKTTTRWQTHSLDECNGTLTACKLRFGENNEFPLADSRHVTHQELICVRKPLMPSWLTLRLNIHASVAE